MAQILMAKMMEQGPVLVLHFEAQQLTQNDDADDVGGVSLLCVYVMINMWLHFIGTSRECDLYLGAV